MIEIAFVESLETTSTVRAPVLAIAPLDVDWNDFRYQFRVDAALLAPDREPLPIEMRVMFSQARETSAKIRSLLAKSGPFLFASEVNEAFCAILESEAQYSRLVAAVGVDDAVIALRKLGDVVMLNAFEPGDQRLALTQTPAFHLGLVRQQSTYEAWRRAARQLRLGARDLIKDSARSFELKFWMPGSEAEYRVDFDFEADTFLRNRLAVLVGRNGAGKTRALLGLIEALAGVAEPDGAFQPRVSPTPHINAILAFSSVASDSYPRALPPNASTSYRYFSLVDQGVDSDPDSPVDMTGLLADIKRNRMAFDGAVRQKEGPPSRRELLNSVLQEVFGRALYLPLAVDRGSRKTYATRLEGRDYFRFSRSLGEQRTLELLSELDWFAPPLIAGSNGTARQLSSGEHAMFRFAVQAIGAVEPGSLLVFDEPETHMHPRYVSMFMEILSTILEATGSIAIIATHSAYVVREAPRQRVRVLGRQDGAPTVSQPRLQTFAASIDSISRAIFDDDAVSHLHDRVLRRWLERHKDLTIDAVVEAYGDDLNVESLTYLARLLVKRSGAR